MALDIVLARDFLPIEPAREFTGLADGEQVGGAADEFVVRFSFISSR